MFFSYQFILLKTLKTIGLMFLQSMEFSALKIIPKIIILKELCKKIAKKVRNTSNDCVTNREIRQMVLDKNRKYRQIVSRRK